MNKFLAFVAAFTLLVSCGGSDEVVIGEKTTYDVNEVFNGGKVIKGETILAKFKITNTGKYPLVIASVEGSCSCTVVEKPEDPISPGESYTIEAEVDTDRTSTGAISKAVTIVANTEPSIKTVVVKATVLEN